MAASSELRSLHGFSDVINADSAGGRQGLGDTTVLEYWSILYSTTVLRLLQNQCTTSKKC